MAFTAEDWPIAAAMLPFAAHLPFGAGEDALRREWSTTLQEVADAGFAHVDLTDSWLRYGDLDARGREALRAALADAGLGASSVSAIRRSVIEQGAGEENLAYSHRTLEFAAEFGIGVVSVGLHQALTPRQREQLWFWTVEGHRDRPDDAEAWALAVRRFRELGAHAADLGILLSLEMYEHTFLGTAASAVRMVEEIGMREVGLNPDVGNLIRLHEPIEDWREVVALTAPFTNFWHVKNYTRDEDPISGLVTTAPAYLESGLIDYRAAFRIAIASGFQGVICTEHYGGDGLSMSAANRDYLRGRILPRRPYEPGTSRVAQHAERVAS
ncbi:sugar phosphate isomerase/epimerase family protein [Microbacterium sp. NPDC087591]|uniref:sugar phosphate isomerase/epimerase family protein n=1 Tax=Microbacterium sp. NPDC087591 TaxID=3364192 RepID=UPI00381F049C